MPEIPRIISVDDHVLEPPDLWSSRLPSRYRERGPRIVRQKVRRVGAQVIEADDGQWCDVWHYDDTGLARFMMLSAAVGFDDARVRCDDLRRDPPGAWKQPERLADMDANHIEAAVCFPNTLPRFCGQTFLEREDKELAAAVRAGLQRLDGRRVVRRARAGAGSSP